MYAKNTQNYREYPVAHATVYLNDSATDRSTQAKGGGGVKFVMVGHTDPSNSDNQNGDGSGGLVCARVCACVRACEMCLQ